MHLKFPLYLIWKPPYVCVYDVIIIYAKMKQIRFERNNVHSIFMYMSNITIKIFFCCFTSQVNSYGHCGTVSSPNHTFPGQA